MDFFLVFAYIQVILLVSIHVKSLKLYHNQFIFTFLYFLLRGVKIGIFTLGVQEVHITSKVKMSMSSTVRFLQHRGLRRQLINVQSRNVIINRSYHIKLPNCLFTFKYRHKLRGLFTIPNSHFPEFPRPRNSLLLYKILLTSSNHLSKTIQLQWPNKLMNITGFIDKP